MIDLLVASFVDLNWPMVAGVMLVFFFAGIIKGVVGFGMPLFAISIMAFFMPLTLAIAANVAPSLSTNIRQAFRGPYLIDLVGRLWPFLVPAIALIWVGIAIQMRVNPAYPGLALGILAVCFAALSASRFTIRLAPNQEKPVGFVIGLFNGVITGVTGIFIIPGALYLQALGLKRDELVQALGLLFMLSTGTIGVIFTFKAIMTVDLLLVSLFAVPPAFLGMAIGERLRVGVSEGLFRKLFLLGVGVIGTSLIVRNGAALL